MKILVFGKNGQVGHELINQNQKIIGFSHEELDVTDQQSLLSVFKKHKPDVVINASAYHVVPECEAHPEKAFAINSIAVKAMAELCEEYGSRFVHYSTDYVFDGVLGKPYKEDATPHPLQLYGISKLAGEYSALTYCQNSIIIRSAYIYGGKTGSKAKRGNFVLTMLAQSEGKDTLEVAADQIVSPTYATDLAQATLKLLSHKQANGVYHFVNQGSCSLAEFAQAIMHAKKRKTRIIPVVRGGLAGNLKRPVFSVLRNTRGKKLGVVLPPWKDAVKRYVQSL